jgi:hypothetical protein
MHEEARLVEVHPNNLARLDRKIEELLVKTNDVQMKVVRIEAQHEAQSESIRRIDSDMRRLGDQVVGLRVKAGGWGALAGLLTGLLTMAISKGLLLR